jgi:hypothetical protein
VSLKEAVEALKSLNVNVSGFTPVLKPMRNRFGSDAAAAEVAASKNRPGTASRMSEKLTVCPWAVEGPLKRIAVTPAAQTTHFTSCIVYSSVFVIP